MDKSPDAFRTISEVADELDLPQHVLRFWETRFNQIKPMKRGGGRRYYRPDDVELLKGIRHLLYSEGYTIKGVQRILKEHGNRFVAAASEGNISLELEAQAEPAKKAVPVSDIVANRSGARATNESGSEAELQAALSELLECKRLLDQAR
ncbi:MerR family transcriptional regulator [Pseudahrensia aquimaris]|uniref:MerR family transcriptional regulator n=1 Tax=Pseudahrensia aquimaris TaxID=744461 RepID=A0ABW3FD49_9HYPH